MTIEGAIKAEVMDTGAITAIIGTRFYRAGTVPQNVSKPYATFQKISDVPVYHQGGDVLSRARVQVNCVDDAVVVAAQSIALAVLFRSLFNGFRGTMGTGGATATVRNTYVEDISDATSVPSDGSAAAPSEVRLDVMVFYVP